MWRLPGYLPLVLTLFFVLIVQSSGAREIVTPAKDDAEATLRKKLKERSQASCSINGGWREFDSKY